MYALVGVAFGEPEPPKGCMYCPSCHGDRSQTRANGLRTMTGEVFTILTYEACSTCDGMGYILDERLLYHDS